MFCSSPNRGESFLLSLKLKRNKMSKKKDHLKGLSQGEIKFLSMQAKIFVDSIVKQAEKQHPLLPAPNRD